MRFAFKQASMVIDESTMKKNAEDKNPKLGAMQLESILSGFPYLVSDREECLKYLASYPEIEDPQSMMAWLFFDPQNTNHNVLSGPIGIKSQELQIVTAPVLVPGEKDSDGEIVTKEKIEEVALKFLPEYGLVDVG